YGIAQIFHPDDGRRLGLEGMIRMIIQGCDFDPVKVSRVQPAVNVFEGDPIPSVEIGRAINAIENGQTVTAKDWGLEGFLRKGKTPPVLGITGTGGAGKSSLIDEITQRFLNAFPGKKIAIVCVDPSKKKTGGALLGDRIRMNSLSRPGVYMRSVASRGSGKEIASSLPEILSFLKKLDFDFIIAETSGIGQANMAITEVCDLPMYVMTSDFGAQSQLEKIDMIDFAEIIAVNKSDRRGSQDALRDVAKQWRRSRKIFDDSAPTPVFLTQASQFNDGGVNRLFLHLMEQLEKRFGEFQVSEDYRKNMLDAGETVIIPPERQNYLAEIVGTVRRYKERTERLSKQASRLGALIVLKEDLPLSPQELQEKFQQLKADFTAEELAALEGFEDLQQKYSSDKLVYKVRDRDFTEPLVRYSLSGTAIRRVVVPKFRDWGDRFRYLKLENVPGEFPYTAGVFPLKRTDEEPKRMFAGEGTPERTNRRFHYLCKGEKAHRLSTAFDSVTLYGQDPDPRPDIFGKVGESGVSVCSLEDMKKLYAGFDLVSPNTSVSMTINGPAPMILAFFFNTAIDQQVEKREKELGRSLSEGERRELARWTLQQVRGTV
ncbi:MAG: methylmalonyl-CoA mutase family protein, partial [Bdellovibrionaceae bacterium]|nr:methylmalonyl-CoA mutase family protein [Pseudobdellovibrionaceae bacterium]